MLPGSSNSAAFPERWTRTTLTFGTASDVSAASLTSVAFRSRRGMYPARNPTTVKTTTPRTMDQIVTEDGRHGRTGKPPCAGFPCAGLRPEALSSSSCRFRRRFSSSSRSSALPGVSRGPPSKDSRSLGLMNGMRGLGSALHIQFLQLTLVVHRGVGPKIAINDRNHKQRGDRSEQEAPDDRAPQWCILFSALAQA